MFSALLNLIKRRKTYLLFVRSVKDFMRNDGVESAAPFAMAAKLVAPAFSAAAMVAPDETAYDLFQLLRSSRSSRLPCLDQHLPGRILSPGHAVVLHGEANSGKSVLLRNVLAAQLLPVRCGGHGLPAVLIDAENQCDVWLLAKVLQERARAGDQLATTEAVTEALGRLLIFRPSEPLELLRQLQRLRQILRQNPTAGLLVIDSLSAWHSMSAAFPRSTGATLKECWRAVWRLMREACVAAVISHRDGQLEFSLELEAIHLGVGCCPKVVEEAEGGGCRGSQRECFYLAPWGKELDTTDPQSAQTFFVISPAGEVVSIPTLGLGDQLVAVEGP